MEELKMKLLVRDITIDKDIAVTLPVENVMADTPLLEGHEYIIIEHDNTLPVEELTSLSNINVLLKLAEARDLTKEDLTVLGRAYLFKEIEEMIKHGDATIINFDEETAGWGSSNGVVADDHHFGLLLYTSGYNYLPCDIPEELEDYIRWESNWFAAESDGWRSVYTNSTHYLVRMEGC